MAINNEAAGLKSQIENEIRQYTTEVVDVGGSDYSQYKLVKRISIFESQTYPNKFDSQGNYKFWFDIITPRIWSEVKNIDFDTKDAKVFSDGKNDDLAVILTNLKLKEYLRDTGQSEEFNAAIEEGSGFGNVVWKKIKGGYERADLKNFYVINQTAKSLKDTPVIERHQLDSSDLRAKAGVWENVKDVLDKCKSDTYKTQLESQAKNTTVPYYEIFERNGEVCLKDLKETNREEVQIGDEDKFVFAKVIGAGTKSSTNTVSIEFIMFAEQMKGKDNSDLYEEFHRGVYAGRWFRKGMYELLFDNEVRANQIGNQIARGLEYAATLLLAAEDKLLVQNVLTDLKNGDVIRAKDLKQVDLRMHGFDQLVADWNRNLNHANELANSMEVVLGITPASGTPLGTSQLLNANAGKLFDVIREKLAIPFTRLFEDSIVPDLVDELSVQEVLRLTGDAAMLDRLFDMIVNDWYVRNLVAIGPHGAEIGDALKAQKLAELKKRPELMMSGLKAVFKDFKPRVSVVITGEQSTLAADMETLESFIGLEQDPVRRTYMIEMALAKKGFDVASFPKSPPTSTPVSSPMQPAAPIAA